MLLSTFQHLKGIGSKTENELWRSGIVSWDDCELKQATQLSIFDINTDNSDRKISESSLVYKGRCLRASCSVTPFLPSVV